MVIASELEGLKISKRHAIEQLYLLEHKQGAFYRVEDLEHWVDDLTGRIRKLEARTVT